MYESSVAIDPSNKHLWQYFAFALRHLARWRDAYALLTNLGRLSREHGGDSEKAPEKVSGVEERLASVRGILAGPTALSAL